MSTRQWSVSLRHAETHGHVSPKTILPSDSPKSDFSSKSSIASEAAAVGQYWWPTGNLRHEPATGNTVPRRSAISSSALAALMHVTTSSTSVEDDDSTADTQSDSDTSSTAASRSPSPWEGSTGTDSTGSKGYSLEAHCDAEESPNNAADHAPYAISAVTLGGQVNPAYSVPTARGFQDEDHEPSDEDTPDPKRPRKTPVSSPTTSSRPRFACPYQKYDPTGCRFCCSPNARNPEGGVETISRLRDHMFRNHDRSTRCARCWLKKFVTPEWDLRYCGGENACVERAPPTTYWMTEEQTRQLRGIRLVGSGEENWYHLFRLVLPEVPENGPTGWSSFSPYYAPSPAPIQSPDAAPEPPVSMTELLNAPMVPESSWGYQPDAYTRDSISGPLNFPHCRENRGDELVPGLFDDAIRSNSIFQSYEENLLSDSFDAARSPRLQMLEIVHQDPSDQPSENGRLHETVRQLREENRMLHGQREAFRARLEFLREQVLPLEQRIETIVYTTQPPAALLQELTEMLDTFAVIRGTLAISG
ncbi:hypothetical protein QBC34DRAFT_435571 [Podospora aff. communis PSN243]|uniref:Uncharacterized protein n=1 Tax=Podospora aff. communis PSN243 TaxID=3040156 RepID=A0AAV9GVQ9_9PEZI|nr:hypothetical protein QBC34DRAFT_435571 [Podospora aff. communis PSN243]